MSTDNKAAEAATEARKLLSRGQLTYKQVVAKVTNRHGVSEAELEKVLLATRRTAKLVKRAS